MRSVIQSTPERQAMVSPQERVRASIIAGAIREMAQFILQADKANPKYTLADLRDDDERALYVAAALDVFEPQRRTERANRLNVLRARGFAEAECETQALSAQAREDRQVIHWPAIAVGHCYICGDRIAPMDAHTLRLSATFTAEVHGKCGSEDARCEMVSSFAFRWVGGSR